MFFFDNIEGQAGHRLRHLDQQIKLVYFDQGVTHLS